jgi:hypothetical protein
MPESKPFTQEDIDAMLNLLRPKPKLKPKFKFRLPWLYWGGLLKDKEPGLLFDSVV